MRTSDASARSPGLPTAGCEPSGATKVPVPSTENEQRSYVPIRPAPASAIAPATASAASAGTNTVTRALGCSERSSGPTGTRPKASGMSR